MTAHRSRTLWSLAPLVALWTFAAAAASTAPPAASLQALDYAFRFATAIKSDPKDRAKAQELALDAYAARGAYDVVVERAEEIDGWRRGVVYADLATGLARAGRTAEARLLVDQAERVRNATTGWENPRIAAHVAEALAVLGDAERSGALTAELAAADPIQYAGHAVATEAVGRAARGDFDQAMARLRDLEGNNDLDISWSRTSGYLALARQEGAPRKARLEALDAARASAESLPIERRLDALLGVGAAYSDLGRRGEGKRAISAATRAVETHAPASAEKTPYLIAIGRSWAAIGEPDRARQALGEAERLVDGALSIDRPGLLARIASAYRRIPDGDRAEALDRRAVDTAAAMPLSRPRALSLSAICREMGQDGVAPDEALRLRLETLLAGLGDPW